jgi:eukaryotic-like serine/threonine-protein kinase
MEALTAQDPARIGPFRLVARLGRGGMGRVYLGREESSGRHAAVKTIHGELAADPEFRTRFTQEVNAALRVRDEYIAEVVLADPAAAVPWLATAYVPGISVEDAVRKYGPMPAESVRVLGVCVSRAVAAIHAVGLVHRDLKPGNVLLTAQGPKVIDFGIARGVGDEGLTKTGMVAGSPPYMAPEQLVTGEFGPASDVFSLGSILHYAATSAGPYGRGGAQELYARALAVGPVVAPDLPEVLAGPVARTLSRDQAARPSAAELGTLLEAEPGEKPAAGWLPGTVMQEILTQATEALTTASAAYNGLAPNGQGQPQQGQPSFAPPFPQSGPPSQPSNPRNPVFGPPSNPSQPSNPQYPQNPFGPPSQPSNPQNPYGQPSQPSNPQNPQNPYGQPSSPQNPVFGPPSAPSNPQNPVFAPPSSQPNRPFGPPQQVFQQPQPYPQTPPRQTPMPQQPQQPQQQRPYPQQQGSGSFGPQQRPGTPPQGVGYGGYPQQGAVGRRSNGMGTAGLTLGLIGLLLPCLLVFGVIFSGIGLSRSSSQDLPAGTSKAGLTVSLIGIVGWVLLIIIGATHGSSSTS